MAALGEVVKILELIPEPPSADDFKFPVDDSIINLFRFAQSGTPFFQNPLSGPISQCIAEVNAAISEVGQLQQASPISIANKLDKIGQFLTSTSKTLGRWNSHINNALIGEMNNNPGFLGQIENSIRIRATAESVSNALNACQDESDFLGSILGDGQSLLNDLAGPLEAIIGGIAAGAAAAIAAFNQARDAALAAIAAIVDLIQKETLNIANMIADAIAWGLANAISSLVNDPCAAAVINAAGTSILLNNLPNLPRFP